MKTISIRIFDHQKVTVMNYNVAEYFVGWLFMAYKIVKKIADLSQTISGYPPVRYKHAHPHTHGHTDKPTIATGNNAMHWISPTYANNIYY